MALYKRQQKFSWCNNDTEGIFMSSEKQQILTSFFLSLEKMESEDMMAMVEKHLKDDDVELFVHHIENFYGITDDEELGMLAQLMVTGYLAAKHEDSLKTAKH
jgi:hypothetical protein